MTRHASGVLVLFPGALGDAVCLEPAIAHLAASMPVTLHARGGAAEVAALYPDPVTVRSIDSVEIARLFAPDDAPDVAAWLDGFARIVSFTGADVPAVVRRLQATGRAVIVRFPRPPLSEHAVDLFLRAVGAEPGTTRSVPRLGPPELAARGEAPPLLALVPGSGGRAKRAPLEVPASLAQRWRDGGGEVVTLLGPAEAGEDASWHRLGRTVRPDSVAELARELAAAEAFVGNDAGPSHVAAALGRPGVVLYATTDPGSFGPRGDGVTAVAPSSGGWSLAIEAAWRALRGRLP